MRGIKLQVYLKRKKKKTSVNHIAPEAPSKISWEHNGEKFSATIKYTLMESTNIVPTEKSPKYDELWKNKTLTGLVAMGSNLQTPEVMDYYLDYYQDQGFNFETLPQTVDFKNYLENQIVTGDLDYFIKKLIPMVMKKIYLDLTRRLQFSRAVKCSSMEDLK